MRGSTGTSGLWALGVAVAMVAACDRTDELGPGWVGGGAGPGERLSDAASEPDVGPTPGLPPVSVERWTHDDVSATFDVRVDGEPAHVVVAHDPRGGAWSARIRDPRSGELGFGVVSGSIGSLHYVREFTAADTCVIAWHGEAPVRETYRIGDRTWTRSGDTIGSSDLDALDDLLATAPSLMHCPAGERLMMVLASPSLREFLVSEGVLAATEGARYQPSYCPDGAFCGLTKCTRFDHANPLCIDCYGVAACIVQILFCREGAC